MPRKEDLDRVAPAHPVALHSHDEHLLWVNSAALRAAGVDRSTADPPGGRIDRDEGGEPTGVLRETAGRLIWRVVPPPSAQTRRDALRRAMAEANCLGLTGIHDCDGGELLGDLEGMRREGELTLRGWIMIPSALLEEAIRLGLKTGFGDDYLRVGGVKVFTDGALGPRTAHMLSPYEGEAGNTGIEVTSKDDLREIVRRANGAGLDVAVHAIGDRANRETLDILAESRAWPGGGRFRPRIEHVQLLHLEDIGRFASIGVIASMQPIHATSDMWIADRYWGERARWSYAWRSLLDAGARLAFGSDCPVETLDPLQGLYAAVTRRRADGTPEGGWYPQERITLYQAVHAYTLGAAYTSGEEHFKGSLRPGKAADLIVLSQDIFSLPPEAILEARVEMTVFDGRVVWR